MEFFLTFTIFGPLVFAAIALLLKNSASVKGVCTLGAFVVFVASVPLAYNYSSEDTTLRGTMQAQEKGVLGGVADANARKFVDLSAGALYGRARSGAIHKWDELTSADFENQFLEPTAEQRAAGAPTAAERTAAARQSLAEGRLSDAALDILTVDGSYDEYLAVTELRKAARLDLATRIKFATYVPWIDTFNIYYFVGVDGLSVPLVVLTTLLIFLCLVYSWTVDKAPKGFYILFLLLETGLVGVFCALDFFLFYVFWEVVLLPSYFLIGIWGGPKRTYAAIKFFIYTLVGSVLMLLAMLALYFNTEATGVNTFNMLTLLHDAPNLSFTFQAWIFAGMFIAFAIKVPVFPFHTWLPDAHVQAPTAFSVMLAGLMLKMGGYGFFRLLYPLCPDVASHEVTVYLVGGLGVINIVYGALVAMAQTDFKSLVAYSSISHMGYVLLGLAAWTSAAFEGAALQMVNHGIASAMMFFLVGVIYDRAHHRDLNNFGGIGLQMPWYTGIAMVGFFSSLGLPGLNSFISEVLVFLGAYQSTVLPKWMVYTALLGILLGAAYILWTIKRVFLGELTNDKYRTFNDLDLREFITLVPLAVLCVVLGVYPKLIIDIMDPTMHSLLSLASRAMGGAS